MARMDEGTLDEKWMAVSCYLERFSAEKVCTVEHCMRAAGQEVRGEYNSAVIMLGGGGSAWGWGLLDAVMTNYGLRNSPFCSRFLWWFLIWIFRWR